MTPENEILKKEIAANMQKLRDQELQRRANLMENSKYAEHFGLDAADVDRLADREDDSVSDLLMTAKEFDMNRQHRKRHQKKHAKHRKKKAQLLKEGRDDEVSVSESERMTIRGSYSMPVVQNTREMVTTSLLKMGSKDIIAAGRTSRATVKWGA